MQNHRTRIKMAPTNAAALSPRSDDSETSSSFSAEAIIALVALFLMVAVPCTGYIFRAHAKGWLRSAKHWYRRLKRQAQDPEAIPLTGTPRDVLMPSATENVPSAGSRISSADYRELALLWREVALLNAGRRHAQS